MEAIILAGGLGTRIAAALPGLPKVLAPIGRLSLLERVLENLSNNGFQHAILALGYRAEQVRNSLNNHVLGMKISMSIEDHPLGTGGACRSALVHSHEDSVFVLNGDTLVDVDYQEMFLAHRSGRSDATLAVTTVADTARFGRVRVDGDRVVGFSEKGIRGKGEISAGVYILERDLFQRFALPESFSIEKDFFVPFVSQIRPMAFQTAGRFIDIGIPDDLARARIELP